MSTATDFIIAGLVSRLDYLNDRLTLHRDAFTPAGVAALEQEIAQLEAQITATIGATR